MLTRSSLFSIALLSLAWNQTEAICNNSWTATGAEDWNKAVNWGGGCVPGTTVGDIANFSETTAGVHSIALDDGAGTAFNPTLAQLLVPNTTTYNFTPSILPPGAGLIIFNDPNGLLQCSITNTSTFSCALSASQLLTIKTLGQAQLTFDSSSSLINTPATDIRIINQTLPAGSFPITIASPGTGFASTGMAILELTQGSIINSGITGSNATSIIVAGINNVAFTNNSPGQFGFQATQIIFDTGATVANNGTAEIGTQATSLTFKGTSTTTNALTTSLIGSMATNLNVQDQAQIQNGGAFGQGASNITFSGFGTLTSTSPLAIFGGAASVVSFNNNSVLTGTTASTVKLVSASDFTVNDNASVLVSQVSIVNALTVNNTGQFHVDNTGGGTSSAVTGIVVQTGGTIASSNQNIVGAATVGAAFTVNNAPGINISGGQFNVLNNAPVSGPSAVGSQLNDLSNFAISGGTFNLTQGASAVSLGGTGAELHVTGSGTLSGGTTNFTNNGSTSVASTPAVESLFNTLTVSQTGLMNLTNNGTVTGVSAAAAGVHLAVTGAFSQLGASGCTSINTNTIDLGTGSAITIGAATSLTGTSGSSFTSSNTGNIISTNSLGTSLISTGAISLGNTSVTLANSGIVNAPGGSAIGTLMSTSSITNTSILGVGSNVAMTNSGAISGSATNIGTALQTSGGMTLSSGAWAASNSGSVSAGNGIQLKTVGDFIATGGSLNLNNTGAVTGSAIGARLTIGNALTVSGGTVLVDNTAAVASPAFGSAIQVTGPISLSSGAITVANTGCYAESKTGPINISGGVFTNNGITAALLAQGVNLSGGVLQSKGGFFQADPIVGGNTNVINSGGNFVPGALDPTIGTTTIVGTYTQNAGTFTLVIGNLTSPVPGVTHGFLIDTGTGIVSLNGGNLNVVPATGFNPVTDIPAGPVSLQFIQASTVINGGFDPVNPANPITFDPSISSFVTDARYETIAGNQGWLFFTFFPPPPPPPPPRPIAPRATPIPNQPITISTINHINTFLWRRLLDTQLGYINDQCCVEKCSPRIPRRPRYSPSYQSTIPHLQSPKGPHRTIAGPTFASANPSLGFTQVNRRVKEERLTSKVEDHRPDKPWKIYLGPTADFGKINNKHSEIGCHFNYAGALAGFDYTFSHVGTGLMVDYEHVSAHMHKHAGRFWIHQFHVNSYTTYVPSSVPEVAVMGIVGAGGSWYDIHRNASFSPKEVAHAKTKGAQVDALLGTQYVFHHNKYSAIPLNLRIVPMLNLQYIYQGIGSYKEHQADLFDHRFSSQSFQSLRSTLGLWLEYTCSIWGRKNLTFTPLFNLAWQREYLDPRHKVRATPIHAEGPSKNLSIFGAGRDTLLTGLDLLLEFYKTYGLEFSYDFEYNNFYHNNTFYLGFNVNF